MEARGHGIHCSVHTRTVTIQAGDPPKSIILRFGPHPNPSQILPETFQNRFQIAQDAPKRHPSDPRGTQETPKTTQGAPKRPPRDGQGRPRGGKNSQDAPKSGPTPPKMKPRGYPKRELTGFWRFLEGRVRDTLFCSRFVTIASRFYNFSAMVDP